MNIRLLHTQTSGTTPSKEVITFCELVLEDTVFGLPNDSSQFKFISRRRLDLYYRVGSNLTSLDEIYPKL